MSAPPVDLWARHLDPGIEMPPNHALDIGALTEAEHDGLQRIAAVLADDVVWSEPSVDLRARVLAGAAAEVGPVEPEAPASARSRAASRWFGSIAGAGIAAAVVLVALMAWPRVVGSDVTTYQAAATDLIPAAEAEVDVEETTSGVALTLRVSGLPPAGPDEYYAGWLVGERGVVGVGSFHLRDGLEPIELWSGVDLDTHPRFMVTQQAVGEPPTPSDRVVLMAVLVDT